MLGGLFRILLCFLIAMQPPSKSLFAELYYYRLADTGQPILIKLVDNVAAELASVARNVDAIDQGKITPNLSDTFIQFESPTQLRPSLDLNDSDSVADKDSSNETQKPTAELIDTPSTLQDNESHSKTIPVETTKEAEAIVVAHDSVEEVSTQQINASESVDEKAKEKQEDIPSFSEWAQKQLEEAEKNKETVLNDSSHSVHKTTASGNNLKIRSKNYASPDCGAKIIAANPESGSAGYVLSSSRDEYMLNTCTSRIWFVVELCEAIQAKKIDLANFELFSSTPKNFSVFVSDRFPTRDWAGVGQFTAQDVRDVQTFNLHPHLFGKFIKVELHSHYGSEHYCPVSLFRVYGTSEYEVFETENLPHSAQGDDDDNDDEQLLSAVDNNAKGGDLSKNLFGSARDAVMSIMKKAAEVLVKSNDAKNATEQINTVNREIAKCQTPSHIIVCDNCSNALYGEVYDIMSCRSDYLKSFIDSPVVYNMLCNSDMCQSYGLDFKNKNTSHKSDIANYLSAFLVPSYVAALCNMLAVIEKKVVLNTSYETDLNITSNLTIDKKTQTLSDLNLIENLLQEPFTDCSTGYCETNLPVEDKKEITDSHVEVINTENGGSTTIDIKPTKTLELDTNDTTAPADPNVATQNLNNKPSMEPIGIDEKLIDDTNTEPKVQNDTTAQESVISLNESSTNVGNVTASSVQTNSNPTSGSNEDINSSQEQASLDSLLNELDQGPDLTTPTPTQSAIAPPLQGQKESVFLRLSNRIKALEKNMSLSSQYLEELSRRYKKQVEEMQKTFEKTLLSISEESKRGEERDQRNSEEMLILQQQIAQLSSAITVLLSERDSWFGNNSLFKLIVLQVITTLTIIYVLKKKKTVLNMSCDDNKVLSDSKIGRKSDEANVSFSESEIVTPKRRLSEELMSKTSTPYLSKSEKKRRRRKTSLIHRSVSMTTSPLSEKLDNKSWLESDLNSPVNDTPIALEEAEFIVPEAEPLDLCKMGNKNNSSFEMVPKKEFPKTNGTILGIKMIMNNKKPVKVRRLSSPAFFQPQIGSPNFKSENECENNISNLSEKLITYENIKNEKTDEGDTSVDLAMPSNWSSTGELSQCSTSATSLASKSKRSKKNSFKNILKKVF